jgi:dephospho-CoA kinase
MLKVGLTGGIGCGKSAVSALFTRLDVPVIDADTIAHRLVEKGRPALTQIRQVFDASVLNQDGSLNRKALREMVFTDPEQKQKLEAILHPLIYRSLQIELAQINAPYCIISIPLLFETRMTSLVDRVLVVDCPVEAQIERVRKRDNLSVERIQSIINTQVSRADRKARADDLIDNSDADYRLAEQVKKLHNFYLSISDCRD